MKILIYSQHLLGVGHLIRSLALAHACAEKGFTVRLLSGGRPTQHANCHTKPHPSCSPSGKSYAGSFEFIQLPALHAVSGDFTDLRDENNAPIDARWKARRQQATQSAVVEFKPDIVLFELFPFGRRQLQFELLPLLSTLVKWNPRPNIICSVRDVLQQRKAKREQETIDLILRYFDLVLVHSDPNFIALDASFSSTYKIKDKIRYTGYIYDPHIQTPFLDACNSSSKAVPRCGVIVSAGGSAVGLDLIQTAIQAKPLSTMAHEPWCVRVSDAIDDETFARIQAMTDESTLVERNQAGFAQTLMSYHLSISQCGYNTVMDVIHACIHSIMVPYAKGEETEQIDRARTLASKQIAVILAETELSPKNLAQCIDQAMQTNPLKRTLPDCEGLQNSVQLLTQMQQQKSSYD